MGKEKGVSGWLIDWVRISLVFFVAVEKRIE